MCGLFGASTPNSTGFAKAQSDFLEQAMYVDAMRGWDSTGLAIIDSQWKQSVYKRALPAADFAYSRLGVRAKREVIASPTRIVIGHNRAATVGSVTDDYAHPFKYGSVVGAHNGTLKSRRGLVNKDAPVDSMDLIHAFSETAPKDYPTLLSNLDGAYALTLANSDTKRLYFARNTERPLHLVWNGDNLYWGSELGMIYWLLERNKIGITADSTEELTLDPHVLYTYDPIKNVLQDEAYTPAPKPSYGGGTSGNYYGHGSSSSHKNETTYISAERLVEKKVLNSVDLEGGELMVNIKWKPYPRSEAMRSKGNPVYGEIVGEWWYSSNEFVPVICPAATEDLADSLIRKDGGCALFTPTGGQMNAKDGKLVNLNTRVDSLDLIGWEDVEDKKDNVVPLNADKKGMKKESVGDMPMEKVEELMDKGCTGCRDKLGVGDMATMSVYNGKPFCGLCSDAYQESLKEDTKQAAH